MNEINRQMPFSASAVRDFALPEAGAKAGADGEASGELNLLAARIAEHYRSDFLTPRLVTGACRLFEFLLIAAIGLVIFAAHSGIGREAGGFHLGLIGAGSAVGVVLIGLFGGYRLSTLRGPAAQIWRVASAWSLTMLSLSAFLFFLSSDPSTSRLFLGTWFVASLAALFLARAVMRLRIRAWARDGRMERRAVIVGGGGNAETLIRGLEMQPDSDIRICGIFDDRDDRRSPPIVAGYPKLGTIAELVTFARMARIDMLIVTLPLSAEKRLLALLKQLWVLPLDIRLSAHSAELVFRPRSYSFIGDIPMIDVFDRPLADWDWVAKRVFDVAVAALAILALSPVFLATALAVRLDSPGPVLFRQKRHGFNNQIIEVFKFRSLYHHFSDPEAKQIVTKNDKRVTRVGAFIRKTSLDELPQLLNVLKGDLSLVGPRPHALHAQSSQNETFTAIVDGYFGRHRVKPGITGWAQIKGWRGEIDQAEKLTKRFEHDLFYIENWSLLLDLYILAMTPVSLVRKTEGAY